MDAHSSGREEVKGEQELHTETDSQLMLVDAASWVGTSAPPEAEEEVEEICPDKGTFVHMWNCVKRSIFILWLLYAMDGDETEDGSGTGFAVEQRSRWDSKLKSLVLKI